MGDVSFDGKGIAPREKPRVEGDSLSFEVNDP